MKATPAGIKASSPTSKLTPCLWFDHNAEEAVDFYRSIFDSSKVLNVAYYGEAGPGKKGTVMTISFQLAGLRLLALNGGPYYQFTPAVSLMIDCRDQDEVDGFWNRLSAGGRIQQCGWLTDKFGLSWQVVPRRLIELLQDRDAVKAQRVMGAMLQMTKLDIAALEAAARRSMVTKAKKK